MKWRLVVSTFVVILSVGFFGLLIRKVYRRSDVTIRTELQLPVAKRLIGVSWKEGDLWFLLRSREPTERPETWTFVKGSLKWPQWPEEFVLVER